MVSLRKFSSNSPENGLNASSDAPWTVSELPPVSTTDVLPIASGAIVTVCVASLTMPLTVPTLITPTSPVLSNPTVALSKVSSSTVPGILTCIAGSSLRVNKKPVVVTMSPLSSSTTSPVVKSVVTISAGLKFHWLTEPGRLAEVPSADTAMLT